jgi:hypothetical protein
MKDMWEEGVEEPRRRAPQNGDPIQFIIESDFESNSESRTFFIFMKS